MRAWVRAHRRAPIVGLVISLFALSGVLRPQVEAIEEDANRDELLDEATAKGMTEEQASCIVDGLEDQYGSDLDSARVSSGTARETLAMIFECVGVDLGDSECIVDAVVEIMDLGEGGEVNEFVEAAEGLDADDRERIVEAGLRCQGASAEVAACVTDAMRDEFGDEVFELSTGPGGSVDGQRRIAALMADCANEGGQTKSVMDLAVGDCVTGTEPDSESVSTVPVVDCTQPHDAEVFAVADLPDADSYPADTIEADSNQLCLAEFEPYVGKDFYESALDLMPMYPTNSSWAIGDRSVICFLALSGEQLTATMRGARI